MITVRDEANLRLLFHLKLQIPVKLAYIFKKVCMTLNLAGLRYLLLPDGFKANLSNPPSEAESSLLFDEISKVPQLLLLNYILVKREYRFGGHRGGAQTNK